MNVMDLFDLTGRVAVVTGGSRGLGLQMAEALGEAGAAVAITARREPDLTEAQQHLTKKGIRCLALPCDISEPEQVESTVSQIVSELGGVDILLNNAGATWGATFDEIPLDAWDRVVRTNVNGTFYMSRAAALSMIQQGRGGRIINNASIAGLGGSDPQVMQTLPYNTSKGAVVNFTRDLAVKLAEHDITVNCICPGFFPTKMTAWTLENWGELVQERTPLRRFGSDHDLKGLTVLLASDASAFITGQVIAVDGGRSVVI